MKNSKALKLLAKIQDDLSRNGIITNTLVADLQDLRHYAVEDKNPLLAKTIRLTFEHIEANQTFAIAIPDDEPIEGIEFTAASEEVDAKESLAYLLSLFAGPDKKSNALDLREYCNALIAYAEEN